MTRLLMLTTAEFGRDPRARRAATTAAGLGAEVVGLCDPLPDAERLDVAGVCVERTSRRRGGSSGAGLDGATRRGAPARELRGLARLGRQSLASVRLAWAGAQLGPFDIVHAHDFDALPAGAYLARRSGARLVYDAHELYTMQEPDPPRLYSGVVRRVEGRLARRCESVVTVNDAIADELQQLFCLSLRPIVVLSCPPLEAPAPSAGRPGGPLRVIYQSGSGPGRSPADLLDAAAIAEGAAITIRLTGTDLGILRRAVDERGLASRVEVAEPVPADRLVAGLGEFDVGVVINRPVSRNDELALPNKLFEYLMAGLTVVVPELPSMGRLVRDAEVGVTFDAGDPAALGRALGRLARDRPLLERFRERAREIAVTRYNAEAEAAQLVHAWGLRTPRSAAGPGSASSRPRAAPEQATHTIRT